MKRPAYAILELETGYLDGWYHLPLSEVKEIARFFDEARPPYRHRVIAMAESFAMDEVTFLADVMFARRAVKESRTMIRPEPGEV